MEKPFSLQSPLAAKDANRRIPLASRDTNRKSRLATKDPNRKRTSLPSKNTDRRDPLTSKDADRRNPRAAVKDADRRNTINRSKDSCPRRSLASIDTNRPLQSRETHIKQSKNLDPRLIVMTNRERNDKYTEAVLQRSNTTRNQSISLTATTLTERSKRSSSTPPATLKRSKRHYTADILATRSDTSPISSLNTDCLYQIFRHCGNIETLCILASVCRQWREIILDPFSWRNVREEWESFVDMLCLIDKNPKHLARKKLLNTRTVHMFGSAKNDFITTTPLRIKARLFTNVTELVMTKLYFQDMIEMITQTPLLEVLRCDIIRTRGTSGKMMLGLFSGLDRLRVLDLRFREPCEYTDHAFTISRRRVRKVLPTSLQELRLSNVYDPEEMSLLLPRDPQQPRISNDGSSSSHSTGTQQQQQQHGRDDDDDDEEEGPTATVLYRRRWMEDTLVDKYQFLHPLTNLKTLRLGRCNAYTARVWRECIKPCVGNLEYLTLVGWYNNNTETLLSASSLAPTQTKMEVDEDTQLAIQETILEVQHKMKRFVMLDFVCGPGVVGGIKKLKYVSLEASFLKQQQQQPDGIVGGTAAASDGSSNSSIGPVSYSGSLSSLTSNADELLNQHVSFCRINF